MDLKIFVGSLSVALLATFAWKLIEWIISKYLENKNGKKIVSLPNLNLENILAYKKSIENEETTNHEFDDSKDYYEKISIGSIELKNYMKINKTSICNNYRMG